MNSKELKIFLSSTFIDLQEIREKTLKFLSVLKSDVINMEVFGSDESKPKDYCLQKVDESNFFIGIYAERYGSIDSASGLSLTELEYHLAYEKLKNGTLKGLLLYVLDGNASWPLNFVDRDPDKVTKLQTFKKLISQRHTLSFFKEESELPFNILRDTIRKLEIGNQKYFIERQRNDITLKTRLDKPVGMEFFSQELAKLFFGRDNEENNLCNQILSFRFSLLIGVSGVGKTSLLNAGLISKMEHLGWVCSLIRPLNDPIRNLKNALWNQLMEGSLPSEFDFIDVIRTINTTFSEKNILIIIDQFEDILNCRSQKDIDLSIANLMQLYVLNEPRIHILISYRGDVESDLGVIWQKISGAADGLPRFYLNALDIASAAYILKETFQNLEVTIEDTLINTITNDLNIESQSNGYNGVFPPFLQMAIVTIYERFVSLKKFDYDGYSLLNGSKGIIGSYLINQLEYLAVYKDQAIKILISLVSNYGTKTQKNIKEIIDETNIEESLASEIILKLIDLRLVRTIDAVFEITHDLLAKNILKNLITEEELNIRKFKFLLESKTASYQSTNSDLTIVEHFYLYKYRAKIQPNEDELKVILSSSKINGAPIYYWLNGENVKRLDKENLMFLVNDKDILYPFSKVSIYSPKKTLELSDDIENNVIALSRNFKNEKLNFFYNYCSTNYIKNADLTDLKKNIKSKTIWKKLVAIIALGKLGTESDFSILEELAYSSNDKIKFIALKAIITLTKRSQEYTTLIQIIDSEDLTGFLTDLQDLTEDFDISLLPGLSLNFLFASQTKNLNYRPDRSDFFLKVIRAFALPENYNLIREHIKGLLLDTRQFIYDYEGLFELCILVGCDFQFFIEIIKETSHSLHFSYYKYLHEKIADLADDFDYVSIRNYYNNTFARSDWEVQNGDNKYLLDWIMACAFSKLVRQNDKPILIRMLAHNYWTVQNAAIRGLEKISDETDIDLLLELFLSNREEPFIKALRILDKKYYYKSETEHYLDNLDSDDYDDFPF